MLTVLSRRFLFKQFNVSLSKIRTYLSGAYTCQELWEQRKKNPIFEKIDYNDLYHQLDRNFQVGNRISVLDVDIFANGIESNSYLNELEDMLFKLRMNPETGLVSDRTMHAVVKFYLSIGKKQDLLTILSNRLNFGIFLDNYLSNVLMDEFLKEGDTISAAKVAVLQMLQEDFDHKITNKLSLLSCFKYLNSSQVWSPPKEPVASPDDEDEERVRVPFLRNPYFDDHFDLIDTNHLLGKTIHMIGELTPGPLGISCQLVGLALHEKISDLSTLLERINLAKEELYEEALNKVEEYLKTKPKQGDGNPAAEDSPEIQDIKNSVLTAIAKTRKNVMLLPGSLDNIAEEDVIRMVRENESKDISALSQIYREWEKEREQHIQFELFESEKRKTAQEITKVKSELKKKEEMIFFFDKEDEWDLIVEQKESKRKALAAKEASRKKKIVEEIYIPPEVGVKRD